jgi:3-methyladenine DNA glycosylase AlkD
MLTSIPAELRALASEQRAGTLAKYFKTGPGEYGEGDVFIGLTVPQLRSVAKKYVLLPHNDLEELLASPIHEYRLLAVMILVYHYEKEPDDRKRIYDFYLQHTARINNWDLVDASAAHIVGDYLQDKSRQPLYKLAGSKNLWERRIAIVATHAFIKKHQFADTIAITNLLIGDKHDLIHKACGWMLREVGKQDRMVLERYLRDHAKHLPRTTLRYSIERFPVEKRKHYMQLR